jgi:hypothetical protein
MAAETDMDAPALLSLTITPNARWQILFPQDGTKFARAGSSRLLVFFQAYESKLSAPLATM